MPLPALSADKSPQPLRDPLCNPQARGPLSELVPAEGLRAGLGLGGVEPGCQPQDHGLHALCAGPLLQQGPTAVCTLLQELLEAEQGEGPRVHQLAQHDSLLVHEGHLEQQGEQLSWQQRQGLAGSWLALQHLPCAQEHKCVHGARPGRRPPAGKGPSAERTDPRPPPGHGSLYALEVRA